MPFGIQFIAGEFREGALLNMANHVLKMTANETV
jgi:Asp-tRNA(Asn)/Glu-tRNA(Gln) amidotransferase A subunit family amidase